MTENKKASTSRPPDSEESNLLRAFDPEDRRFLLDSGSRVTFQTGDVILREGEEGDSFFMLIRGEVEVTTEKDGKTVHLATLTKGAVFGEVPVISRTKRTATVTALTSVGAIKFENSALELLLVANPHVKKRLEDLVLDRAKNAIEKMFGDS